MPKTPVIPPPLLDETPSSLTAGHLYEALRGALHWRAVCLPDSPCILRMPSGMTTSHPVGYLNPIRPGFVQIIGEVEHAHLMALSPEARLEMFREALPGGDGLLVLADDIEPPEALVDICRHFAVPVFRTALPASETEQRLSHYLEAIFAERTSVHGVFLEVHGTGVLLTGESGVGKSELALELISRGHRLIADDAPLFSRDDPYTLEGYCPPLLQDFLEVRGLGVLDIRRMYGDNAVKTSKLLRLIVHLVPQEQLELDPDARLEGHETQRVILGVGVPELRLPVAPGRNLAVMVEVAVRNHNLKRAGYNSASELSARLGSVLEGNTR